MKEEMKDIKCDNKIAQINGENGEKQNYITKMNNCSFIC